MLNRIKKYRSNPKRTVVTFSFQKKLTLNHLGDLVQKEDKELIKEFKELELDECTTPRESGETNAYVLENDRKDCKNNQLKEKKKQIEQEQAQILEKDNCTRAFKENYHIKPLEFAENKSQTPVKQALKMEREVRGGIVCEKSFKMLLCDLAALAGAISLAFCLLAKLFKHNK